MAQIARFEDREAAEIAASKFLAPGIIYVGPRHTGVYKVPASGWYVKVGKSFLMEGE